MEEIRCPMCGKPNPAELDVCQFCGARLKPLHIDKADEAPKPEEQAPTPYEQIPRQKGKTSRLPDWLHTLGAAGTEPQDEFDEPPDEKDEDVQVPPDSPSEGVPDWIGRLQENVDFIDDSENEFEESLMDEEDVSLDWLKREEPTSETTEKLEKLKPPEPKEEEEIGVEGVENWEGGFLGKEPQKSETSFGEDEPMAADILQRLRDASEVQPAKDDIKTHDLGKVPPPETSEADNVMDAFPSMGDFEEETSEGEESSESLAADDESVVPNWLSEMDKAYETDAVSEEPIKAGAKEEAPTGDVTETSEQQDDKQEEYFPDWLTEEDSSFEGMDGKDALGWLSRLHDADVLEDEPGVSAEAISEGEGGDIGGSTQGEVVEAAEDIPDWLSNIKPTAKLSSSREDEALESLAGDELEKLIEQLPEEANDILGEALAGEETDIVPEEAHEIEQDEDVIPGWLRKMGEETTGEHPPEQPLERASQSAWVPEDELEETDEGDLPGEISQEEYEQLAPDWDVGESYDQELDDSLLLDELSDISETGELVSLLAAEETGEETIPEISEEEVSQGEEIEDDGVSEPVEEGELPSWLKQIKPTQKLTPTSEMGKRLASLEAEAEEKEEEQEQDVEPVEEGELPTWLKQIEPTQQLTPTSEVGKQLASLEAEAEEEDREQEQDVDAAEEGELPTWLKQIEPTEQLTPASEMGKQLASLEAEAEEKEEKQEEVLDNEDEGAGNLLSAITKAEGLETLSKEAKEEQIPEWLAGIGEIEDEPEVVDKASESESLSILNEGDIPIPGWIKELDVEDESPEESLLDEKYIEQESVEEDESQVVGDIPSLDFDENIESVDEDIFQDDDLPAWLSSVASQSSMGEGLDYDTADEEEELAPAELPSWLRAMRPNENEPQIDLNLIEDDDYIEGTGPLAGIHSVLSAEPEVAGIQKPRELSFGLSVTKEQQASADLLQKMLANEFSPEPLKEVSKRSSKNIWRLMISVVLLLVVGGLAVSGTQMFPFLDPASINQSVIDANQIIRNLQPNSHVLLAIDIDPSNTGEMKVAAVPVIDHLMIKGANLAVLSTSPSGPAIAEYLLKPLSLEHGYTQGEQYVNLGYLPGGATGLLSFAMNPQFITQQSINWSDAWNSPSLKDVRDLSDFDLVVVVSSDFSSIQTWIEQIEPQLREKPMIVVSSAQSAPLVMPYYESANRQLDGVVDGFLGGVAYEQLTGKTRDGRRYWDAFVGGEILAVIAILISVILYAMRHSENVKNMARKEG